MSLDAWVASFSAVVNRAAMNVPILHVFLLENVFAVYPVLRRGIAGSRVASLGLTF